MSQPSEQHSELSIESRPLTAVGGVRDVSVVADNERHQVRGHENSLVKIVLFLQTRPEKVVLQVCFLEEK